MQGAVIAAGIVVGGIAIVTFFDASLDDAVATSCRGTIVAAGIVVGGITIVAFFDAGIDDAITASGLDTAA